MTRLWRALPAPVRWLVRLELGLWRSLARLVARRPAVPAGARPFPYHRSAAPVIWTFIVLSAIELVVVHLVLPWQTVRMVVLWLSIYGLLWMVGLLASLVVHPHVVGDDGVRIRSGVSLDLRVPWESVAAAAVRRRDRPGSRSVQFDDDGEHGALHVIQMRQTNVDLTLAEPVTVTLLSGRTSQVTTIRCWADDPHAFVAAVRR